MSYIVFGKCVTKLFTFRSSTNTRRFLYGIGNFIFLVANQLFWYYLLRSSSFANGLCYQLCHESNFYVFVGLFLSLILSSIAQSVYYCLYYLAKNIYIFLIWARQGSYLVVLQECLSYFWAFVLSKKFENHLVNFQIHKSEVIIALFPIAVEKEVNWKFNCCFFEGIKGQFKNSFLIYVV